MDEHTIFHLMASGPVVLACLGALLLAACWFAERDERKNGTEVNGKLHRRVTVVGVLLMLPGVLLLAVKLIITLRLR